MASTQRLAVFAAGLLAAATSVAAQIPLGSEFRVDRSGSVQSETMVTTSRSAAAAEDGTFMLTWVRNASGVGPWDIMGRIIDADGTPRPPELLINVSTGFNENDSVAVDDGLNFVVVWSSLTGGFHVRGRTGYGGGSEFQIGTSDKTQPAVAKAPDGKFVVVWIAGDGDGAGIFAQRFEPNATPIGGEFQVNTYTTGQQYAPSIDVDGAGDFVIVWADEDSPGSGNRSVRGQRFSAAGVREGAEFIAAALPFVPGAPDLRPRVSRASSGPFVIVWQGGSDQDIASRRFDATGVPVGAEFVVNTYTTGVQRQPDVDMDQDGDFVIAWTSEGQDGFNDGVFARRFAATGAAGPEFRVNTYTTNRQWMPRIAVDPAGNFVVGWHSYKNGESTLQAQRYAGGLSAAALAVDTAASATSDGNGVLDPGETVVVAPSWLNASFDAVTFSGTAAGFDGPSMPGATYTIADDAAAYGTLANGATGSCTATANCYALRVGIPTNRTLQHWDALFLETMTPAHLGVFKAWPVHVGDSFDDVPRSSGFYRFVETMLHRSITGGCANRTFCPSAATVREHMAVFVLASREALGYQPPACATPMFADVPASSPFCPWIEELARRGVVAGCGGGNYCPRAPVSREQMAVFALRAKEPSFTPPPCGTPMFNDVPASSPFCRWIEELARRGVVAGCGGGSYCPASPVTREQMSVFLTATFGLTLYGP